jgi:hypothetical protein
MTRRTGNGQAVFAISFVHELASKWWAALIGCGVCHDPYSYGIDNASIRNRDAVTGSELAMTRSPQARFEFLQRSSRVPISLPVLSCFDGVS